MTDAPQVQEEIRALFADWLDASIGLIHEFSGDWDWSYRSLAQTARQRASVLGIEWMDLIPEHERSRFAWMEDE